MRSPLGELYAALAGALGRLGVRWYVFGAQAALLYGAVRVTADVDITVDAGTIAQDALVDAARAAGFAPRIEDVESFVARTRVLPLVHTASQVAVDVVLAGSELEQRFLGRARPIEIEGTFVRVAAPEDVVAMKLLAGRSKDVEDAVAVVAVQGDALAVPLVRETLGLLEQALDRRDLLPLLDAVLERAHRT